MPAFRAALTPRPAPSTTTIRESVRASARASSAVPSVDPSSTTTASQPVSVCAWRDSISLGLLLAAVGLALLARAPVEGDVLVDVMPGMLLIGIGAGMAFNPVLLAAMSDVAPEESGLASGVVNTSFMMGGALGLAVLASLAASRTETLEAAGSDPVAALNGGYHVALLGGALFAVVAAVVAAVFLRAGEAAQAAHDAHGMTAVTDSD